MTYHHQAVGHDASISASPNPYDDGKVRVEIAVGDLVSVDLDLWPDTAEALARDLFTAAKGAEEAADEETR